MKQAIADLAILGGPPAFAEEIHVGRPNIGDRAALFEKINDILDRRWVTNNGHYVQEFERKLAATLGVKHCIAMCNATIALEITTRALGFKGEVIVPSFTFVATAHSLQWQEITPVFCDIDPETHNIDPQCVDKMVTPRTTGIIGVHVWGRPCAVEELTEIARRHNLKLMFDAAHAFGCTHRGRAIGSFGSAEVFSFHATKFLNSFEGGAVATNDDELAQKIRLMKNFGFAGYDNVIYVGTNGKMNEVSAAMGLTGLENLDEFIEANRSNYLAYQRGLSDVQGVHMVTYDEGARSNYQFIVFELDEEEAGLDRDTLIALLHAENVLARRYFFPGCHKMMPYRAYYPHAGLLLPHTERLASRVISLPTGSAVGEREIDTICAIIRLVVENSGSLSRMDAPV